jgi:RNA polymerase sigma-54 factor
LAVSEFLCKFVVMNEKLQISQSQKTLQHLAPQQVQFVKMLEMSAPEIEDEVRRELDENPALEELPSDGASPSDENDALTDDGDSYGESAEELQRADYADDDDVPFYRADVSNRSADDDDSYMTMDRNAATESLSEMLENQLREYDLTDIQMLAATYIIGNLDVNGRMTRTLMAITDDIQIATGVEVPRADILKAFETVRSLDPAGVGAVDLRDCLLIQLKRKQPKTLAIRVATEIIDHYFDLFAKKHYEKISAQLGLDTDRLKEAIDLIKTLSPKPGNATDTDRRDRLRQITPDFIVEHTDDDRLTITLNQRVPELAIEESFAVTAEMRPVNRRQADELAFVKRKHDEARSFIGLLKRRSETLMAVMKAIVSLQRDFFISDEPSQIKPMILKDIAALTGFDLSVISRATAGKYVATARAIYPLKMFLNERPTEESDVSSHQILEVLKEIIDNEDPRRPLSDEAIKAAIAQRGYDLARRTVTKYRERLSIPVARLRKKI